MRRMMTSITSYHDMLSIIHEPLTTVFTPPSGCLEFSTLTVGHDSLYEIKFGMKYLTRTPPTRVLSNGLLGNPSFAYVWR